MTAITLSNDLSEKLVLTVIRLVLLLIFHNRYNCIWLLLHRSGTSWLLLVYIDRFFLELCNFLLYLFEPCDHLVGAAESVQGPLLPVLLKDQQNENDHITVEVVEVTMPALLIGRMIHSTPKHVEDNEFKNPYDVLSLLVNEGLSYLIDELCWIDNDHAEKCDNELK